MAEKLHQLNAARRLEQDQIFKSAEQLAGAYEADPILVLADAKWSHGIVGIVASKLAERYQKPTLVLQIMDKTAKGSGRSFGGFDLITALKAVPLKFIKVGGHKFAAGFTLKADQLDLLRQQLNKYYKTVESKIETRSHNLPIAANTLGILI